MLGELLSIGGSLLGGVLQGNAADKAADAQASAQQQAMHAQQRATNQAQQLYAPGVAAYSGALNALTQRFGLPTQAIAAASGQNQRGGSFNADEYLAANPDVMAEFRRLSPNNLRNNLGIEPTPQAFAQWHYVQHGQYENRPGSPSQIIETAAPAPTPTPAPEQQPAPTNALAGSYGNTKDPTWTPPPAFSFDIDDFKNNPAYQFALEQGSGQVMANASATGALQSGAALKRLQDRGQTTAYNFYSDERDKAYQRWLNDYNLSRGVYESDRNYLTGRYDRGTDDLFGYLGIGQSALNSSANAALGQGAYEGQAINNIGQSTAGNALAQGNIWSGVVQGVAGQAAGIVGGGSSKKKNNLLDWSQSWGGGS